LKIFSQPSYDTAGSKYAYLTLAACSKAPNAFTTDNELKVPEYLQIARDSNILTSSTSRAGILANGYRV
jgi:hypothetical protein